MSEYDQQAQDFLNGTGATITMRHTAHDYYFEGDDRRRDIYTVTLSRGKQSYIFKFGQSIAGQGKVPSDYDILACLNPYGLSGDFHDFCGDYGYEELDEETGKDSKAARKIYKAVMKEVAGLKRLFRNEQQLEQLANIN